MPFPRIDQYSDALQHPVTAFTDPELKNGKVQSSGLGLPLALGGGFALTYTIKAGTKKYAVRCFHREAGHLEDRYSKISSAIGNDNSGYFVGFEFQKTGVLVEGRRYPLVKMDWAEGDTFGVYLENHHTDKLAVKKLREDFLALEKYLGNAKIAHGDLQIGNLIVSQCLKLIDYDGIYVPGLPIGKGFEDGQRHFQHPKRTSKSFGPDIDRFSFIVIDLSLRALAEVPSLFDKYSNGQNIILTGGDFLDPDTSNALSDLRSISSLASDTENFIKICKSDVSKVPALSDFISGQSIPIPELKIVSAQATALKSQAKLYCGAYDVVDATDFDTAMGRVGDRVELLGKIVEVKKGKTKYGQSYIFVNFDHWKGNAVKLSIWSDGLKILKKKPNKSWVGKYVSVTGLVDPAYSNKRFEYIHVGITITEAPQLKIITKDEALWRLGQATRSIVACRRNSTNQALLNKITGSQSTQSPISIASSQEQSSNNQQLLAKIQGGATKPKKVPYPTSAGSTARKTPIPAYGANQKEPMSWFERIFWIGFVLFILFVVVK